MEDGVDVPRQGLKDYFQKNWGIRFSAAKKKKPSQQKKKHKNNKK